MANSITGGNGEVQKAEGEPALELSLRKLVEALLFATRLALQKLQIVKEFFTPPNFI
jgi:hypothetical protein